MNTEKEQVGYLGGSSVMRMRFEMSVRLPGDVQQKTWLSDMNPEPGERETRAVGVQVVVETRRKYEIIWKSAEQRQWLGQNTPQFTNLTRLCSLPPCSHGKMPG